MDWKDVLGELRNSEELPEGDESNDNSEKPKDNKLKNKREKLHIAVEKKGRGGKTATIIYGFERSDEEVAEIAAILKKRLGTGGSARGGEILIQGEVADKVRELLKQLGIRN